jgi:arabinan endo-1,5-alpha-L-arabinosidase
LTLSGNTFAHDPTMIAVGGTFYRFWTGDSIPSAKSTNLTNWQNARTVYTNGYSKWVTDWLAGIPGQTFGFPWAPDVSYFNGRYHIYSTYSAKFGDNISCITHLSTTDIANGSWTDHGPVICTNGSENYNAIDADVGLDANGTPWLAFGSFWNGIHGFQLNPDGSRLGTSLTRLAWASQIEAPVLFYRCGYYYLFVTWGLCCPGEGRTVSQLTYRVAVGRSRAIMGPYVDRTGKPMIDGGGTLLVQGDQVTWAAAGHSDVMVNGSKIYHLYHAYLKSNGAAQLRIVEMPFDSDGWPVPAGP